MRLALLLALAACGRIDFDARDDAAPGDAPVDSPAPFAAFVQATAITNVPGPTTTVTFTSPIAAGDTIIVAAWSWGSQTDAAAAGSVTDTANGTLQRAANVQSVAGQCGGMNVGGALFYAHAATMIASDTITFTSGDAENGLIAMEYASTLTADQFSSSIVGAAASPQTFSTPTVNTTTAPELLVSLGIPCAGSPGSIAWTSNPGFNMRGSTTSTGGQPAMVADSLALTAGPYTATWTITFATNPAIAAALITSFR